MRQHVLMGAGCALVLTAAGCASAPAPPPMTTLDGQTCPQLRSVNAVSLSLGKKPTAYPVAPASDCLIDAEGKRTTGKLFALPSFVAGYWIDAASLPVNDGLLPLRIQTLDSQRNVTRTLSGDKIFFRGTRLSTQLFFNAPDAADRYLLVSAAPSLVGTTTKQTVMGSTTQTQSNGLFVFNTTQGFDQTLTRTFSYDGMLEMKIEGYPDIE